MIKPVYFLLVDDLEENLLSLGALLRRDGLVLLKARSGDEALEFLLKHEVALALVDVQMPGLNGFELAELMRGNERTRRVPIIFLTAGTADNQRRFKGYEAGAVDFLQKPIEPDILRSKVDVFYDLYRQRQQIAEHRDALETHAEALKEADLRKDEFLATLAHELRNPLATIRHGLDILRRTPETEDGPDIRDMMDRQLRHLVRLIDDLLDVSRVSQGKIELRPDRILIAHVIQAALETSRPIIDAAQHHFEVDVPAAQIWVNADLTRLAQVVSNLLNNAAKYTPRGGNIVLAAHSEAELAVITVSDDGIGIPVEMQSKVFQLFAQIDNHDDQASGGLGIGLALVRQLITMHSGTVAVESAGIGKGSKFTVRLPLAEQRDFSEVTTQSESRETVSARRLKVLVVDDNAEVAQTIGWMLEAIGHDYLLEHKGKNALQAAMAFGPDAILLDIGLPDMDGYAVCRAFRAKDAFRTIPIIAQTGWGGDRDRLLAAEAGFDHHLVKPASLDDLEGLLAKVAG